MTSVLDGVDLRTQLAGANRLELLLFRLHGRQSFGINVFKVKEVIQCPHLTRVPKSHPVVRGVASIRGQTFTVIDLSMAIGMRELSDIQTRFVIVTEYNRTVQGFLVGSVDRIVNMNWSDIKSPPKATAATSYMTAVTEIDGGLVQIVDVEKVMKEVLGDQERVDEALITAAPVRVEQHILVADDSMVARKQVTAVLDQLGANYTETTNGKDALEQLRRWVAEGRDLNRWLALVISDIEMPLMDGYALAAEIRKDPAMKDLFIILHTSLSGVFNENLVRKVGANHFLSKYDANELARQVQKRLLEHAELIGSGSN